MLIKGVRKAVEFVKAYVPGKTIDEVKEAFGLDEIIKLGSNENPYGPFENAKKAMMKEIDSLSMYPDHNYEKLKQILGLMNGLKAENVALSHGAGGMLETLAKTFIEEGDEVIIPEQTYGLYREISKLMGAEVISSPLTDDYRINIEDMIGRLTEKTKLIWLCNPNNPTGTIIDEMEFEALLEKISDKTWVVMDEAYVEFSDPATRINTLKYIEQQENVIVVRTMSKAYGLAGARIGYALADIDMIRIIETVSEPFNANRIGLAGAVATLTKDREAYNRRLQDIIDGRKYLINELTKSGMECIPSEANFVFFQTGFDAASIGSELLKRGIIVRPCTGWGYDGAIRVTVGTKYENRRFLKEFNKLIQQYS